MACASKGSSGAEIARPVSAASFSRTLAANSGWVLSPVPVAVPPSGIWPTRRSVASTRWMPEPHLRRVAAELLAEGDRDRVHQVGAAGLDHVGELLGLRFQRLLQATHRRQQVVGHLAQRRQVDGGGEDVVGGLAHVDVIVGVGPVAGEVGDHLVGVHVRGGAGAGLEDVDRELVVVLARGDGVAGRGDPLRERRASSRPSSPLARAAAALSRPSQRTTGTGTRSPETGKLSTALVVSPPQSCSAQVCASIEVVVAAAYSAAGVAGVEAPLVGVEEGRRERPVVGAVAGGGGEAADQLDVDAIGAVGAALGRAEQVAELQRWRPRLARLGPRR